jgi:hypothetical protein
VRGFFRSVGVQLSLALLLVVAVVLGIVYLSVVPSLRDRAINTRVAQMERIVAKIRPEVDDATPFKTAAPRSRCCNDSRRGRRSLPSISPVSSRTGC